MIKPAQKFFVGQLVQATKDYWPYLKAGQIGIITFAKCQKVYTDSQHKMEWAYVGRFDMNTIPQGVRFSMLSPIEVI